LVFNAHGRYTIPDGQVGITAKMAEILRIAPKEAFYFDGPPLDVKEVHVVEGEGQSKSPPALQKGFSVANLNMGLKNPCSMVFPLPSPSDPANRFTVDSTSSSAFRIKRAGWSHWEDITTLAQWQPTLAVYDEEGWQCACRSIPWHHRSITKAGSIRPGSRCRRIQKLACPMPVRAERRSKKKCSTPILLDERAFGLGRIRTRARRVRDFLADLFRALSTHREMQRRQTKVRLLASAANTSSTAKIFAATVCQALPVYERWFGPYPYAQFTIAEACFGWNGNECSAMVLIDDRMYRHIQHRRRACVPRLCTSLA